MIFHIITAGCCWLILEGSEPRLLKQGALVLLPQGKGHKVVSEIGVQILPLLDIPVQKISQRYEIMKYGGGGQSTELTCGVVSFDQVAGEKLVALLPDLIIIDSWDNTSNAWLQSTSQFIATEARVLKPGGETIITHLADILVIQAIRAWVDSAPEAAEGWLAALRDRQIGRALFIIHRQPMLDWSVTSLAKEVGMSRSGFSAKFTQLVGDSAKRYLTKWRMKLARQKLLDNAIPIAVVAEQFGYHSEAAFSRAFKRIIGVSPGSIRQTKS